MFRWRVINIPSLLSLRPQEQKYSESCKFMLCDTFVEVFRNAGGLWRGFFSGGEVTTSNSLIFCLSSSLLSCLPRRLLKTFALLLVSRLEKWYINLNPFTIYLASALSRHEQQAHHLHNSPWSFHSSNVGLQVLYHKTKFGLHDIGINKHYKMLVFCNKYCDMKLSFHQITGLSTIWR